MSHGRFRIVLVNALAWTFCTICLVAWCFANAWRGIWPARFHMSAWVSWALFLILGCISIASFAVCVILVLGNWPRKDGHSRIRRAWLRWTPDDVREETAPWAPPMPGVVRSRNEHPDYARSIVGDGRPEKINVDCSALLRIDGGSVVERVTSSATFWLEVFP